MQLNSINPYASPSCCEVNENSNSKFRELPFFCVNIPAAAMTIQCLTATYFQHVSPWSLLPFLAIATPLLIMAMAMRHRIAIALLVLLFLFWFAEVIVMLYLYSCAVILT